ncbi:MAG: CS1-pili formation C-terminal domain-containing protein [Gammaproteobacteria bacterium]|nr:CS1-pili formation C-terminal domain-containing protein [Gammaproteobacteria bacterium]
MNGAEGESTNFNVGNSTTVAWQENRLYAVSNLTRDEDFSVDTLALQREVNGQQLQGGIFRSNPGTLIFLRQADFQGISLASSLNTRQDLDQSAGNDLQVFLDSRSRVDILKDGRLISSAVYNTGNQILDTSQLPGGAYEVTLRIRDNFGGVREETRFYVKTNRLPPKDQPLYFIDVGETVEDSADRVLPEGTGDRFFRAGYARRLSENFGGEVGVLASEENSLFEAGIFRLGRWYEIRLNGAVGNDNSRGVSLGARTRIGTTSINTNIRKVWSESTDSPIGNELTQASLNLSIPFGRSSLNVTARYNDRETSTDRNIGLRYDFPTYRFGDRVLDTSLQVTQDNGSVLVLLGARLSIRAGRWQNRLSTQVFRDRPENMPENQGVITDVTSTWQDGDRFLSDVTWIMRANDAQDDRTLEGELDVAGGLGQANVEAVYSDEAQRFSYSGNFYTSMIANAQTVAIGARQQGQSAVVLDIEGAEKDAYFDVEINGMRRGTAPIGEKTVIGLTPFDTYEVSLQPRGSAIVDFEQRPRRATLYPGNVVTMEWSVARVVVAFGQIVRPDGDPVADAVIEGVIGLATTDEFGVFQAEFSSDTETLTVRTRDDQCRVELPDYDGSELMVTLGKLTCR